MKKALIISVIFFLSALSSKAQFSFGLTPGFALNGFYLGYQFENLVPYIGFQYGGVSYSSTENYNTFDQNGRPLPYSSKYETTASIYLPFVGAKYFAINVKDLKGYATVNIFKPLISVKDVHNGVEDPTVNAAVNNYSIWGFEFGVGTEYFLSKQFSLGGEFGIHFFLLSSDVNDQISQYNPSTGNYQNVPRNLTENINLNATYAKMTLNYYFKE